MKILNRELPGYIPARQVSGLSREVNWWAQELLPETYGKAILYLSQPMAIRP